MCDKMGPPDGRVRTTAVSFESEGASEGSVSFLIFYDIYRISI
jgi:hypothetical protein